ncbi:VRR-NUC domain-containing protein, partial [Vibrio cholerae]
NQPNYHFGEYYVLKKYLELGWQGTAFYALGDWELNNDKYVQGRAAVAQFVHPIRLAIFKALRQGLTSGEPDLFLYKDDGSVLFVEVKRSQIVFQNHNLYAFHKLSRFWGVMLPLFIYLKRGKYISPKLMCLML